MFVSNLLPPSSRYNEGEGSVFVLNCGTSLHNYTAYQLNTPQYSGFESRLGHACLSVVSVVLSGRGLCDGLVTRQEESYRVWCVSQCDHEASKNEEA
jgi:hypothetical protein